VPTGTVADGSERYYESTAMDLGRSSPARCGWKPLSWWQQVPRYGDEYRCVTFDHRGFGASTDVSGQFIRGYTTDLEGLLTDAGVHERVLVGQSMGCFTCSTFAAAHPERVRGLVMADTFLGIGDEALLAEVRAGSAGWLRHRELRPRRGTSPHGLAPTARRWRRRSSYPTTKEKSW
jgi:pimeloyl-ACP methyl ester carboxylesterase